MAQNTARATSHRAWNNPTEYRSSEFKHNSRELQIDDFTTVYSQCINGDHENMCE